MSSLSENTFWEHESVELKLAEQFANKVFWQDEEYICNGSRHKTNTSVNVLRIDYLNSDPHRYDNNISIPFHLFSFYLAIVEYVTCQMNMIVRFEANYVEFYQKKTFIMDIIPFDFNATITGNVLFYDIMYEMVILTVLKVVKSKTYFSFIFLFDWIFWLILCICSILMPYLWKLASQSKYSIARASMDIMRTLTSQSSHNAKFWTWLRKRQINLSLSILMYFWFFVINLTTKWMSGLLLDSYLPDDSLPLVDGISDLVDDHSIEIIQANLVQEILDHEQDEQIIEHAKSLMLKHGVTDKGFTRKDELTKGIESDALLKILQGQSVALCDSYKADELLVRYSHLPLDVAKEKYARNYNWFWVSKRVKVKEKIFKLIRRGIETGLDHHLDLVQKYRILFNSFKDKDTIDILISNSTIKEQDESGIGENIDHTKNDNDGDQDHSEQQEEFVITVASIARGCLLVLLIGILFSIMVFFVELGNFYYQNIYLLENGFDLRNLKSYDLKSVYLEPKTHNTIILTYQKNKELLKMNPDNLHPVLRNNFDLYLF